jgi:hypothetical protein
MAMGCINFKKSNLGLLILKKVSTIANMSMSIEAGNTQTPNVKNAKLGPPILNPMAVMV